MRLETQAKENIGEADCDYKGGEVCNHFVSEAERHSCQSDPLS